MKKGKIVSLEWRPGSYINSGMGYNKNAIKKAAKNANTVLAHGHGNYSVIQYSQYIATFVFEDGTTKVTDIKRQLKETFNISKMTENQRNQIESHLPLDVEVDDCTIKFLHFSDGGKF